MKGSHANIDAKKILVSDFDGTMTQHDFYKLAIESLLPTDVPDYWAQYRGGTKTHFEALQAYFASIRATEAEVLDVVRRMELDPNLSNSVQLLHRNGWRVVVTSAGCAWYIHILLKNVDVEICANPGRFESGKGLLMEPPIGSSYFSPTLGVDKTGIVRRFIEDGSVVAFAGDGFPDVEPSRLVKDQLRFARADMAGVLHSEGLPFHNYQVWSDIADNLIGRAD